MRERIAYVITALALVVGFGGMAVAQEKAASFPLGDDMPWVAVMVAVAAAATTVVIMQAIRRRDRA